ncbi:6-O-methylguanine DNA methyltransferase [Methylovirgula sp. 4M-Z18]|nr:6-O-methylguanine DNA methyltransferase [Methylovirgula sp. 4M-Z18]
MMKTWREKLLSLPQDTRIIPIPPKMRGRLGEGMMVVPSARAVEAALRTIRRGRLATAREIAQTLAGQYETTVGCVVTTGIVAAIIAQAADEEERMGAKRITPYWRMLKQDGELNLKYPGGLANLRTRLEAEGHIIVERGRRFFIEDYAKRLIKPPRRRI